MTGRIRLVDAKMKEQIDALRMEEYARATGFVVDLSTLKWRRSDDESYVVVAEENGRVVSTMRGEVIDNVTMLESKLECPWDFPLSLEFPVLLLSRAATSSSHRTEGLNLVLRHWFLRFAEAHGLPFVIGTFVAGSPRENTLREMGYRFFENSLGWQRSTYRSLRPVQVVALDMREKGAHAIRYCLNRAERGIEDYRFEGEFPELRFVTCL